MTDSDNPSPRAPKFRIGPNGDIMSERTGVTVLTVNLRELQWDDAVRVVSACLSALEAEYRD